MTRQRFPGVKEIAPVHVTVAIPTYGREEVLVQTVEQFLRQRPPAREILVIDQTASHAIETDHYLERMTRDGHIRWIRITRPSQPGALNRALIEATQPVVLFVDDDIRIETNFVHSHMQKYSDNSIWAVAGQVLQPGEKELSDYRHVPQAGIFADMEFPFCSGNSAWIENGMSGNLSVRRAKALQVGGFDENFVPPVSYRFDAEFCKRLVRGGGRIYFEPAARIYHLRASSGGTRSKGSHLTSGSPMHSVGDYYFALRQGLSLKTVVYILKRPLRQIRTRFHLRHPWWIPIKLIGELRALSMGIRLAFCTKPRLVDNYIPKKSNVV